MLTYEEVLEYQGELQKYKNYRKKYLLIDNGKEVIEAMNYNILPNFNNFKDPFINEELKFLKLVNDLDFVNLNLIEVHEIWEKVIKKRNNILYNTYYYRKLNKMLEYIAFDLKHFIDEVICTISVIKGKIKDDKIFIKSIGDYFHPRNKTFHYFDEFKDLFLKIDDLANSYKHSYANSDFSAIGRDEVCFITLYSRHNNFSESPTPLIISVDYVIREFNRFYKFSFALIDKLTKELNDDTIGN